MAGKWRWVAKSVLLVGLSWGCGQVASLASDPSVRLSENSATVDEVEALLTIVESPRCARRARALAARELGVRKARCAVPRLAAVLKETMGNAFSLEIVLALYKIGDSRALPALRFMAERQDIMPLGIVNTSLEYAIRKCERDRPN